MKCSAPNDKINSGLIIFLIERNKVVIDSGVENMKILIEFNINEGYLPSTNMSSK